jgi:hypothetical protein
VIGQRIELVQDCTGRGVVEREQDGGPPKQGPESVQGGRTATSENGSAKMAGGSTIALGLGLAQRERE